MALSCLGRNPLSKESTDLFSLCALCFTRFDIKGIHGLARQAFYTHTDVEQTEPHTSKFRNLIASSLLEIAFEGKPKGYRTPIYKVYKYEHSQYLVVLFEVEVRLVRRYISSKCEYDHLEIERADYLPLYGCVQRRDVMRI